MGTHIQTDIHTVNSPPKTYIIMKFHLLAVCFVASVSGGHHGRYSSHSPRASKTITELVATDPRFSTLLAAVTAAGLGDTLASPGPFTVFAPTNDAFAKVPSDALNGLLADKAALTKVLLRHVVPKKIFSRQIGYNTPATAGGEKITAKKDRSGVTVTSSSG